MNEYPTITQVFQAILDTHKTAFSGRVGNIDAWRAGVDPEGIDTPALLLEVEDGREWDGANQPHDGKTALNLRWTMHCLLSLQTDSVETEIIEFASEVFRLVRRNKWGIKRIQIPQNIEMMPGQFEPGKNGYECWDVTWEQVMLFDAA